MRRYELLEASATLAVDGTSVAFRTEVHDGDLTIDLTKEAPSPPSPSSPLPPSSSRASALRGALATAAIRDKKVVFGKVTVVGTGVSAAALGAVLAKLEYVVGGLTLGPGLTFAADDGDVQLPSLAEVDGALTVHPSGNLTALRLPGLHTIGGGLTVDISETMTALQLPSLEKVGGEWTVNPKGTLTSATLGTKAAFGAVTVLGTDVSVAMLNSLLANLERVETDLVFGPGLTFADGGELQLPSLVEVGGALTVHLSRNLTGLALSRLRTVGSGLTVAIAETLPSREDDGSDGFASLELPELTEVRGSLMVNGGNKLASLMLPSLVEIGGAFKLYGGAKMTTCTAASLTAVNTTIYVYSHAANLTVTFAQFNSSTLPADAVMTECIGCTKGESGDGIFAFDRAWPRTGFGDLFGHSRLFNSVADREKASAAMTEWLGYSIKDMEGRVAPLLYRASDHGWNSRANMWPRVQNQGPFIMLVSARGYLFGGVNDQSVSGSSSYIYSDKTFLYTLRSPYTSTPTRYPVSTLKYAMYYNPDYCESLRTQM